MERVMARQYNNYADIIDFTRASSGTALTKVSYGEELVTNGTFDSDSDWNLGTGWSISGGVAVATSTSVNMNQVIGNQINKILIVEFDLVNTSGSSVRAEIGGYQGAVMTTSGRYVSSLAPSTTADKIFIYGGNFTGTIDNISVREVTFGTGALTLFNHPVNIPRVEYDADGNRLGLLVEESRTNLIPYSDFSSGWDSSTVTVTANSVLSPDGQINGAEANLTNSGGFLYDTISVTAGTTYTWSWYAKSGTATAWILAVYDETNAAFVAREEYTLTDGESVGNGWYRHSYTFTAPAGCWSARVYPIRGLLATGALAGALGTTYLYNAQVEVGSFPTSAIPTSGSTATRSADVASIAVSEFGYNQSEGTVVVEATISHEVIVDQRYVVGSDQSSARWLYKNDSQDYIASFDGAAVLAVQQKTLSDSVPFKSGLSTGQTERFLAVNGHVNTGVTNGNIPSLTGEERIGCDHSNTKKLNGHLKKLN
jgi:hypothetical protein